MRRRSPYWALLPGIPACRHSPSTSLDRLVHRSPHRRPARCCTESARQAHHYRHGLPPRRARIGHLMEQPSMKDSTSIHRGRSRGATGLLDVVAMNTDRLKPGRTLRLHFQPQLRRAARRRRTTQSWPRDSGRRRDHRALRGHGRVPAEANSDHGHVHYPHGAHRPLDRGNIDTDAILPKQFLKSMQRTGSVRACLTRRLFRSPPAGDRFVDAQTDPIFMLDQPRHRDPTFSSRADFGTGSSREHAPDGAAG